jgi:zinc transporter
MCVLGEKMNGEGMTDPCFVFGYLLDGAGGGKQIDESFSDEGPVWLHIDYSTGSAEQWLRDRGVETQIVESLVRGDTRPRTFKTDDGVLIVLRGININPGADPEDMVSVRILMEPNRIISVRQRRLLSVQDVRDSIEKGRGPRNLPDVVTDLIERLADRISSFVDDIEERVAQYETAVESRSLSEIRAEVSALRRQTATVRRFLAPQRDALDTLYRQSEGILDEKHVYAVREQADRITRYVEDLDLVRERALVVQEELLNRVAQEQNARMYVLSIVAAVFLPITFITGVFGMNVAGLPGVENETAFWVVIAAMLAVSVGALILLRFWRWL